MTETKTERAKRLRRDMERGERLLAEANVATGTETAALERSFCQATMRFARSMSPKGEDYMSSGADLAEYLLSDGPFGRSERIALAIVVLGAISRPPTKPETSASHPDVLAVVAAIRAGGLQKQVAHSFGISLRTVANYLKMFEEREKAIADGLAKARQAK